MTKKGGDATMGVIGIGATIMRAMVDGDHRLCTEPNPPIADPPQLQGSHAKAWLCNLEEGRRRMGFKPEDDATLAHWLIEAPWAHPAWHSYSLVLVHLRPMSDSRKTLFYLDGATHELWLYALDPGMDRNPMLHTGIVEGNWLSPGNFAAQFIEITDELAKERIERTVQLICDGKLSPDTDWLRTWVRMFGDNMLKGRDRE